MATLDSFVAATGHPVVVMGAAGALAASLWSVLVDELSFDNILAWLLENKSCCLTIIALAIVLVRVFRVVFPGIMPSPKDRRMTEQTRTKVGTRRAATYPAPIPNGWYKLCDSGDIKDGKPLQIEALGTSFAVYRGREDGKVHILDAYCPHLGANLAGGDVHGDCLTCPFHKWQFNGEGKVVKIPYSDATIPESAKTRSWPCLEHHDLVLVYFDAEGRAPHYNPPVVDAIASGDMVYRGRYDEDVRMHVQEFAENSVDFAHFEPLHGQFTVPFTEIPMPGVYVQHVADWIPGKPDAEGSHIAYFKNHASLYIQAFGRRVDLPRTDADAQITFVGPGGVTYFHFTVEGLGSIMLFQTHTPIDPHPTLRTEFVWYADKHIPRILVSYVVKNWISQLRNDIDVWENKIHLRKPLLVKGDGPIMKNRRWFEQFYSESSTKLKCFTTTDKVDLDW